MAVAGIGAGADPECAWTKAVSWLWCVLPAFSVVLEPYR